MLLGKSGMGTVCLVLLRGSEMRVTTCLILLEESGMGYFIFGAPGESDMGYCMFGAAEREMGIMSAGCCWGMKDSGAACLLLLGESGSRGLCVWWWVSLVQGYACLVLLESETGHCVFGSAGGVRAGITVYLVLEESSAGVLHIWCWGSLGWEHHMLGTPGISGAGEQRATLRVIHCMNRAMSQVFTTVIHLNQ